MGAAGQQPAVLLRPLLFLFFQGAIRTLLLRQEQFGEFLVPDCGVDKKDDQQRDSDAEHVK